jgi:sulfide dehydrogenase cytochrome subunit
MRPYGLTALLLACGLANSAVLAQSPPATPLVAQGCAGCHGQSGAGQGASPVIAGLSEDEFLKIWAAFRANERPATIMNRIARGYTDAEVAALAAYFAARR